MIKLIIFLVVAGLLAFVEIFLANSDGAVIFRYQGIERTLRLDYASAILLVVIVAGIIIFEVWRRLVKLPRQIGQMREKSREQRGHQALTQGLIAAAAGDVAGAREHTKKAERYLEDEPSTLLLAAQTAQLEEKNDVAQLKFRQMLRKPDTEFLGLRGLLADAMHRGDHEEAMSLARRAYRRSPTTPWVLTTMFDLVTHAGQWKEALKITGDMARLKLIDKKASMRRRALINHMISRDALAKNSLELALKHAKIATDLGSGFSPAAVNAAEIATKLKRSRAGRDAIEKCWRIAPHPGLAKAYAGLVPNENAAARQKRFERLRDLNPNDAVTQLSMAEAAMNAKDWASANKSLDKALEIKPTAGGYRLYSEFLRSSGGSAEKAVEMLNKASEAPLDEAWVCNDTGEVLDEWKLFGPTERFDSVHWQTPPTIAQMAVSSHPVGVLDQSPLLSEIVEPGSADNTKKESTAAA